MPSALYQRQLYHFKKGLSTDTALDAAALLLRPKTHCIAFYRVFSEPPYPDYEREAQKRAAKQLVARAGATLIGAYEQPETSQKGKRGATRKRLQLDAAIEDCQARDATLVIAKFGQLTKSAPILSTLAVSGVAFVTCDRPEVNHQTIKAIAAAAQRKQKAMAAAKREWWAEAKPRGYRPARRPDLPRLCGQANRAKSQAFAAELAPFVEAARRQGCRTLRELAAALNAIGFKAPRGGSWSTGSLFPVLKRAGLTQVSKLQIAAAAKLMERGRDTHVVAARSGFPGRPSSRHLVEAELRRRWAAGERHPSRQGGDSARAWAKSLSEWLAAAHPDMPRMGERAARAALADWLRELAEMPMRELAEII